MKLIFDFDHTLFSTKKLYLQTRDRFNSLGVDKNLFNKSHEESKREGKTYNPEKQFNIIHREKPEVSLEEMKKASKEIINKYPNFIYSDVLPFLEKFKNQLDFFIISYGGSNGYFSKNKIENSGIKNYFNEIFITETNNKNETLTRILKKDEKAFFIDDCPDVLLRVKEDFPKIITIRINRGEGRYKDYPDNEKIDFSVKNLKEIESILTEL